jgi:DNA polymerase-1
MKDILAYRKAAKLVSTYSWSLYNKIKTDPNTGDPVLYSTFWQTQTITGRYSSSDPNFQNIPRPEIAITDGLNFEELDVAFQKVNMRSIFTPRKGKILFKADYSGQEIVVLAQLTKDPLLLKLLREGHDIHAAYAIKAFRLTDPDGNPFDFMNKEHQKYVKKKMKDKRTSAKCVVFGICYGRGAYSLVFEIMTEENKKKLADIKDPEERERFLDPLRQEAQILIDQFYDMFKYVHKWQGEQRNKVKRVGYVETLLGRRRYFNIERDKGWMREAINTPIQGTCGDIIKWVLYKLTIALRKAGYYNDRAQIIISVHDEIVVEADYDIRHNVAKIIKEVMEDHITEFVKFDIHLSVDVDWSINWGVMEEPYDKYLTGLKERGRMEEYEYFKKLDRRWVNNG